MTELELLNQISQQLLEIQEQIRIFGIGFLTVLGFIGALLLVNLFVKGWQNNGN